MEQPLAGVEQALLEEPEPVPDLVADAWPLAAHLVGLPEDRDLLGESRLELGPFRLRQIGVVEAGQEPGDPHMAP